MAKLTPKVSVIIPVYNAEEHIQTCLDSIFNQTLQDLEIITINDGSTDDSLKVLQENASKHKEVIVLDQDNHGQGYARNRAIKQARGDYILFVDADDFIEPKTAELTVARAEKDTSDFVHFDWRYDRDTKKWRKRSGDADVVDFGSRDMLVGEECDELLKMPHYFSVNNLFRRSFLVGSNIRFAEGHLYEDIQFVTLMASNANKVSLLPNVLYNVHINPASSTRVGFTDDRHATSFIKAVRGSIALLKPRTPYSTYYLIKYFQVKFVRYYTKRIPTHLRSRFLHEYVDSLAGLDIHIPPDYTSQERFLNFCARHEVFKRKRYGMFKAVISYKTQLVPRRDKFKKRVKRLRRSI
jgi:glycosyltransferase involved in cell wall biosynthesis